MTGPRRPANGAAVRRLTVEQLHAEAPDDVMVLSETRGGAIAAWRLDGGFAFAAADDYSGADCWVSVIGNPDATPALVDSALHDLGERVAGLTVPRGVPLATWNAAPPPGVDEDGDWDLMASYAAPPVLPEEARVGRLGDPARVQAFLDLVNPHHSVRSDYPLVDLWAGVRDEVSGELLALGALTRRISGVAYLASIATDPAARGRGFGAAVTAVLTRAAFDRGEPLCTLAHYHSNDGARRIYSRVGYRTTHRFSSGHIRR
ncbi:MAG: GNAT family N-acetyltransferase [Actinocrinis sp.]